MMILRPLHHALLTVLFMICAWIQSTNLPLIADRASPSSPLAFFATWFPASQDGMKEGRPIERFIPFTGEQEFLVALALAHVERDPTPAGLAVARQGIAALPQSPQREADEASFAELTGDYATALDRGIRAQAITVVESTLDQVEAQGHFAWSEAWDRRFIVALQAHARDREALAAAWWRLARLENRTADSAHSPLESKTHRLEALGALRRELALTPLSGKVLLTAGYTALALKYRHEAQQDFMAAVRSDPASASGFVGLARVAISEKQSDEARRNMEKAFALAPQQADVMKLRRDVGVQ